MSATVASLISVVCVSLVSLIGVVTLRIEPDALRRAATLLVSFAVGVLLGDAFIHIVPEIFAGPRAHSETLGRSLLILGGFAAFYVIETWLRRRPGAASGSVLVKINILGDAVHNFIDGALIAASYLVSQTLGVSTTIAVLLHELPQELGDFAVLVHAGLSPRRALEMNLLSASAAIVGAVATLALGQVAYLQLTAALLPITAGGFVYIAAAILIPELQGEQPSARVAAQLALMALGVGLMALIAIFD